MVRKTLGFTATGRVTQQVVEYLSQKSDISDFIENVNLLFDPQRHLDRESFGGSDTIKQKAQGRFDVAVCDTFEEFYKKSSMIIDSSADLGVNVPPFPEYLQPVLDGDYNPQQIFDQYVAANTTKFKEENKRIPTDREDFEERIKMAAKASGIMTGMEREGHRFGPRLRQFFPFSLKMMVDRAGEIQGINEPGTRTEQDLPIYVVVTNEPCMVANILYTLNPPWRERIIASSGVDRVRLLKEAFRVYQWDERKIRNVEFTVAGIHDSGQRFPVINDPENSIPNKAILLDYLRQKLDQHYQTAVQASENPNEDLAQTLGDISTAGINSIRCGLSFSPQESYLCDGFLQPEQGLFLTGEYRFRNGFVAVRSRTETERSPEINRVVRTNRELFGRLQEEVIRPYLQKKMEGRK